MRKRIDQAIEASLISLMSVLVLTVLWQVFGRFILQSPSSFTDELSRYLLIWLGTLGSAYVVGTQQHLSINVLPGKLSQNHAARLTLVLAAFKGVFGISVFCLGGWWLIDLTFVLNQRSPAMNLPLWVVYTVIPLSGILICYYAIDNLSQKKKEGI